jgi:transforming growth factor-beta-induced protein
MKTTKSLRFVPVLLALVIAFAAVVPAFAKTETTTPPTIVGTALAVNQKTGEFSTLIAALKATNLVGYLNRDASFTVFAPTDAAFAKLGLNAKNIGSLPKGKLTQILLYHVTRGGLGAQGVLSRPSLLMLNGDGAAISKKADGAYIGNARIIQTNIFASNGVIHVIDSVLLPPAN